MIQMQSTQKENLSQQFLNESLRTQEWSRKNQKGLEGKGKDNKQAGQGGGIPQHRLLGKGLSLSEAPATSFPNPTFRAKASRGLEPEAGAYQYIIQRKGIIPFGYDSRREGNSLYIQVTFKSDGDVRVKRGYGGWTSGMRIPQIQHKPLNLHVPQKRRRDKPQRQRGR